MNKHTRELCHWGIKKGYERKNHKYFARIEGSRPGTYRYFYSSAAYDAWKRAKGVASKIGSDLQTFKKYVDYKKEHTGPKAKPTNMKEWNKIHNELNNTYLYRAGDAIMKMKTPKVIEAAVKFVNKQSGKLVPRVYKDKMKKWTEIDKSGNKTNKTSVEVGIEWLNKRFHLFDNRTSINVY